MIGEIEMNNLKILQLENNNYESLNTLSYDFEELYIKTPIGRESRSFYSPCSEKGIFNDSLSSLYEIQGSQYLKDKLTDMVKAGKVGVINTLSPFYNPSFTPAKIHKWKINVAGLGDVGATLVTGLRLLNSTKVSSIGVFDLDENKMERVYLEANQIFDPSLEEASVPVIKLAKEELFNCDMFVFCVSKFIPPLGTKGDVRIAQYKENSKIIKLYAKMAREANFNGIFAVMSDPVDLLCKTVYHESNKDSNGNLDFKGLAPESIKGYGLGVMNARAAFYSSLYGNYDEYITKGRAFGPHGDGLIIANNLKNYDKELSKRLTEDTLNANHKVRDVGFKPYIAPALSSGAISIINTIHGKWHYSSCYLDGVYFGVRNRLLQTGNQVECLEIDPLIIEKINETSRSLKDLYENLNK